MPRAPATVLLHQQSDCAGEPEPAPEDRHNFALAADGAKLVAANKEAKKAAAILQVDDTFCLTPVKADNWMIIELSQVSLPT